MRVLTLIASATEIVCALGFEDSIVGRSHECDFPPSILKLPVCSRTKFIADGTSYEIDQRIRALLQEGLSVYRVDAERLRALAPDVIVTQIQCEVCAVSEGDVRAAVREWTGRAPEVVSCNPNRLEDVWSDIARVATALRAPERGKQLIAALKARLGALEARARQAPGKPTVACIEWIAPLMSAGNWMPELIEIAGGCAAFGEPGKHSPLLRWEAFVECDPEVILISPCGWDTKKARAEASALSSLPEWKEIRAVRDGRVYLLDGNQYFNRPGPRLVESTEILAEVLHPGIFAFGHEGSGWERL